MEVDLPLALCLQPGVDSAEPRSLTSEREGSAFKWSRALVDWSRPLEASHVLPLTFTRVSFSRCRPEIQLVWPASTDRHIICHVAGDMAIANLPGIGIVTRSHSWAHTERCTPGQAPC